MNTGIELSSKKYVITAIKRKTQAEVLKLFKIGDEIMFSYELDIRGNGSGGSTYANYIKIINVTQNLVKIVSVNQSFTFFSSFEIDIVTVA